MEIALQSQWSLRFLGLTDTGNHTGEAVRLQKITTSKKNLVNQLLPRADIHLTIAKSEVKEN